jgi:hypothetical protein
MHMLTIILYIFEKASISNIEKQFAALLKNLEVAAVAPEPTTPFPTFLPTEHPSERPTVQPSDQPTQTFDSTLRDSNIKDLRYGSTIELLHLQHTVTSARGTPLQSQT